MRRVTQSAMTLLLIAIATAMVGRARALPTDTANQAALAAPCTEGILNGDFEGSGGWWLPLTAYPATYTYEAAHSGARAARLGITNPAHNTYSYSSANQAVYIPSDASSAMLRFWLYPMSADTTATATPLSPSGRRGADLFGMLSSDVQYVLVLDAADNWIGTLLWQCSNARQWTQHAYDLAGYAGQTIQLRFGVYNTGSGGVTAAYLDDATLEICPAGASTATPSATGTASTTPTTTATPPPTATRTAIPTATLIPCSEQVTNGGFEWNGSWFIPGTAYSAAYTSDATHSGSRALRLGIVEPPHNRYSYSDANQTLSIPSGALNAELRFWAYPLSGDPGVVPTPQPRLLGNPLATGYLPYDVQYLLLLDSADRWIDTLLWQCSNERQWLAYEFDLTRYAGRTIKLHYGAYNTGSGGVTAYYLDDVSLEVCWQFTPTPGAPTATPPPSATPSRTATRTASPARLVLPLQLRNWQTTAPTPTATPTVEPYPYPSATPSPTQAATLTPTTAASVTPTSAATVGPYPPPLAGQEPAR